jgi:hypothetical protein
VAAHRAHCAGWDRGWSGAWKGVRRGQLRCVVGVVCGDDVQMCVEVGWLSCAGGAVRL